MTAKFYPLRVKHIEKITADCTVITLDIKAEWRDRFRFRQGQHLTIKAVVAGEELRRSYSICSSPLDGEWKIAVKKVPGGKFSNFAESGLKIGDTLEVMPPSGRFYIEIKPAIKRYYVAFAAGSGITPILSIIKTHLELEPECSFQLFYVNQSVSSVIFKEELESLKNRFIDRFEIFHFLTREEREIPLFNGRITPAKLDAVFELLTDKDSISDYFICGPAKMTFLIRDYLIRTGIGPKQIHFELFNPDGLSNNGNPRRIPPTGKGSMTAIQVIEGGKRFSFEIPRASGSILEAALKRNPDLPFACKGGVCCTCKAKLLEGKVDMEVNYALEKDQLEAGYILTCQAVPLSEKIIVDYDA